MIQINYLLIFVRQQIHLMPVNFKKIYNKQINFKNFVSSIMQVKKMKQMMNMQNMNKELINRVNKKFKKNLFKMNQLLNKNKIKLLAIILNSKWLCLNDSALKILEKIYIDYYFNYKFY